ncbi:MAG TPA: ATP-grasp domain-containing protein [Bryobacteraceae bacterium]|nr:ATP-grasp domain-containing protein [Bryobacteraceae bacterium]
MTILCLASYEKGHAFIRECKRQGCTVLLLTSLSLQHKAQFPVDSIDEIFYMPDEDHRWNLSDTQKAVSFLARSRAIDRIVPLDDFDVEVAASLREHLRVAGMGGTTAHYFRDKLAMRMKAQDAGLPVPEFVHVLNYDRLREFMDRVPAPWVLKPRSMAGAIGIKKVHHSEELWRMLDALGDMQSHYLLERFVPGDIFHVDTIVYENEILFAIASGYGRPPMEVSHQGGIFTTRILERDSDDAERLLEVNRGVMSGLGMLRGVSHTEFIKGREDGKIYFLETSARVGGAHIADLVEAASGLNLWAEWAKLEVAGGGAPYRPPEARQDYAGLLVSLARQEHPDTSAYTDEEIVWRMNRDHHVGLLVKSPSAERVKELLASYAQRFEQDFFAYIAPKETPTS